MRVIFLHSRGTHLNSFGELERWEERQGIQTGSEFQFSIVANISNIYYVLYPLLIIIYVILTMTLCSDTIILALMQKKTEEERN